MRPHRQEASAYEPPPRDFDAIGRMVEQAIDAARTIVMDDVFATRRRLELGVRAHHAGTVTEIAETIAAEEPLLARDVAALHAYLYTAALCIGDPAVPSAWKEAEFPRRRLPLELAHLVAECAGTVCAPAQSAERAA